MNIAKVPFLPGCTVGCTKVAPRWHRGRIAVGGSLALLMLAHGYLYTCMPQSMVLLSVRLQGLLSHQC